MPLAYLDRPNYIKPNGVVFPRLKSPQAHGLVAWWPFSPAGGSRLFDLSPASRINGTLENFSDPQAGWLASEMGGSALEFIAAQNRYVDTGWEAAEAGGLFAAADRRWSVSIWAKVEFEGEGTFLARAASAVADRTFQIYFQRSNLVGGEPLRTPTIVLRGRDTENHTGLDLDDGLWHLHTVTWDGTTARYYVDGEFKQNLGVGTASENTGQRLIVGARTNGEGFWLDGHIAEARVYNHALSAAEVWAQYAPETAWDLYDTPERTRLAWYSGTANRRRRLIMAAG